MKVYSPRPYDQKSPLPGTMVQARMSGRVGEVQRYIPNEVGTFPVAWRDGSSLWAVVAADDVEIGNRQSKGAT